MTAEIKNTVYRRRCRIIEAVSLASLLLTWVLGGLAAASTVLLIIATMAVPYAYLPRWLGLLYAQPFLRLDDIGLHYGHSIVVPWSLISDLGTRKRLMKAPRFVLRSNQWRKPGLEGIFDRWTGLPLSDIDPLWFSDDAFVATLRTHLPEIISGKIPASGDNVRRWSLLARWLG